MPTPRRSELPKILTALPNWVGWREETRPGSKKTTKVPYNLGTGTKASSTNPADWIGFPDAGTVPAEYAGIGFVLTKEAGITGIDLDDCLDAADNIKLWAAAILQSLKNAYAEISPSGKGIKIFAGGLLPAKGVKTFVDSDGNPCVESESDGAIEMYDSGRYFTVTARAIGPLEIGDCQKKINDLSQSLRESKPSVPSSAMPTDGESLTEGSRHNTLLAVAGKLRNEGFDRDALLASVRTLNATKCNPPKPDHEIVGIVDFLMSKPAKYKLTNADFTGGAAKTADGSTAAPDPDKPTPGPPPSSILDYAEQLLQAAIDSKDPQFVLGVGLQPSELILALAQAGSIKQHEAKRRIKLAFKAEIPLRELDARIKQAEIDLTPVAEQTSKYILNSQGNMIANLANCITMLADLSLQFNSFTFRPFLTAASPWGTTGDWTDYDDAKAAEWCQHQALNIEISTAAAAAQTLAMSRLPHFHPVVDYLTKLKWDGEPRIETWLCDYLGVELNDYSRNVGRKWLISAISRVMEPGCQADYTLVLEGPQGKRKSSALRVMGGEWFTDDISDMGNKDSAIQLQGKWIVELAELDAFRKAEMTTIKAWLVRREDHFRPPFGRRAGDFPRQNVFAASTNKTDWALDDTGMRRFWPVAVTEINLEGLTAVRDQLWAEAMFYYSEGELSYLSESVEAIAAKEQHGRQEPDAWKETIEDWAAGPSGSLTLRSSRNRVYPAEVLEFCLMKPKKDWTQRDRNRVTRVLKLAGYAVGRDSRCNADVDGKTKEYWTKPSAQAPTADG